MYGLLRWSRNKRRLTRPVKMQYTPCARLYWPSESARWHPIREPPPVQKDFDIIVAPQPGRAWVKNSKNYPMRIIWYTPGKADYSSPTLEGRDEKIKRRDVTGWAYKWRASVRGTNPEHRRGLLYCPRKNCYIHYRSKVSIVHRYIAQYTVQLKWILDYLISVIF